MIINRFQINQQYHHYSYMPYQQSNKYRIPRYLNIPQQGNQNYIESYLNYVLTNTPKNEPHMILKGIDTFCKQNWMMNIGDQKGQILVEALKKRAPESILQLGCFCGYSSLLMATNSKAIIHTIDPNEYYTSIAKKVHQHAGVSNRINVHIGTVQTEVDFIKQHGSFDLIFIDHLKNLYLPDLKLLQSLGAIKKGTVIVGDNIIVPGAPDYLAYFKTSDAYDSVLYHSFLEYCSQPDAVLVSQRIK